MLLEIPLLKEGMKFKISKSYSTIECKGSS